VERRRELMLLRLHASTTSTAPITAPAASVPNGSNGSSLLGHGSSATRVEEACLSVRSFGVPRPSVAAAAWPMENRDSGPLILRPSSDSAVTQRGPTVSLRLADNELR
jgi:hypothetical protein